MGVNEFFSHPTAAAAALVLRCVIDDRLRKPTASSVSRTIRESVTTNAKPASFDRAVDHSRIESLYRNLPP